MLRGPQGTLYGAGTLAGALATDSQLPGAQYLLRRGRGERRPARALGRHAVRAEGPGQCAARRRARVPRIGEVRLRAGIRQHLRPLRAHQQRPVGHPAARESGRAGDESRRSTRTSPTGTIQKTFTGRASLLWKPTEAFSAEAALLHSNSEGDGGPQVNPDFPGGTSPLDPATTLPSGGPYQEFSQIDQPWSRYTNLTSLDLSYDAGFATVSSTSSYYTTSGSDAAGQHLQSRGPQQRRLSSLLRRGADQSALRLRPGVRRCRAHLHAGSAPGVQDRPGQALRLRARRLLRESDGDRRLDHRSPRDSGIPGGAGMPGALRLPDHAPRPGT